MYLIAGLGNPGQKYECTRHNAGFMAVDRLSEKFGIPVENRKFHARYGIGSISGHKVLLLKPETFMNLSGEAVRAAAEYYDIPEDHVIVICDDVYLELGVLRVRPRGTAGGHHGLENIILELAGTDFMRVRVGVGPQPEKMDLVDFVLRKMKGQELSDMEKAALRAADAAAMLVTDGCENAMNRFNGKKND